MIRINLLPVRAAQKKEKLISQIVILVIALCVALAVCGSVHYVLRGKIEAQRMKNEQTQNEINSLKKKIGEVGRFKKLQKELQGKLDVLDELQAGKSGPVRLLDELSANLAEKVWIVSFRESGGGVSLEGISLDEQSVAQFMSALEASPYYQGIDLRVIEQKSIGGNKVQGFSIACRTEKPELKKASN